MKISFKMLAVAAFALAATGCKDALDINNNPNQLTTSAILPDAILAQALTATAATYNGNNPSYNSYASWAANYWGKTGVVSGYGEETTYNYSNSYYAGLWNATYDNLNDYNIIQTKGQATGYPNHAAIAQIMKVYNFQLLVDEYGDIPYFTALQGSANVTPAYDKAQDIYKDFIVQLDGAIKAINDAAANPDSRTVGSEDIVFQGNMTKWKQFANSLKLRVLLRESSTNDAGINAEVNTQLTALRTAADGFITTDVVVQPGYAQSAGQQNPFYNRYGFTSSGANALERSYQIPTQHVLNQYRFSSDPRLSQLYLIGARGTGAAAVPEYIGAVPGENISPGFTAPTVASRFLTGGGLLKGPNAATALMLLSEHLFNKAEVEARSLGGFAPTAAKADFNNGIVASFMYFYRPAASAPAAIPANLATSTVAGISQYNTYAAANTTNGLVNYDVATTNVPLMTDPATLSFTPLVTPRAVSNQEKILYQKYLAMNSVASTEAWDDYRRTGLPRIPASIRSNATSRPDKLPVRLFYPLVETATNPTNVPKGVDQYTKIFWDVID